MASAYTVNNETLVKIAQVLGGEDGVKIIKILNEKENITVEELTEITGIQINDVFRVRRPVPVVNAVVTGEVTRCLSRSDDVIASHGVGQVRKIDRNNLGAFALQEADGGLDGVVHRRIGP